MTRRIAANWSVLLARRILGRLIPTSGKITTALSKRCRKGTAYDSPGRRDASPVPRSLYFFPSRRVTAAALYTRLLSRTARARARVLSRFFRNLTAAPWDSGRPPPGARHGEGWRRKGNRYARGKKMTERENSFLLSLRPLGLICVESH